MVNPYLIERDMESRRQEMRRTFRAIRASAEISPPPSALRRAAGSAIVRFGLFLNAGAYHCPEAATQR